jgi:AraC-like DNA-binding protein
MKTLIHTGYQKSTEGQTPKDQFDYFHDVICDEYVKLDCENQNKENFFGRLNGGLGTEKLKISEVIADPLTVKRSKQQIAKCADANFLISFQLANQCTLRQNGREAMLTPGSFALYDSTQPYTLNFKEKFHQLVLQIPQNILYKHIVCPEKYTAIPISGNSGIGAVLRNTIMSTIAEVNHSKTLPSELYDNVIYMLSLAFTSSDFNFQSLTTKQQDNSLKQRIHLFINNNLNYPKLNAHSIAESQGISIRYLYRLFENDDLTLHNFILKCRLEKSAELLSQTHLTNKNIEWVAYTVGFVCAAHFSRLFKKHFDLTPSKYKLMAQISDH